MDTRTFERLVGEAVDTIPEPFLGYVDNVVFLVEPQADAETLASLGMESPMELLGLYQGDPLSARGLDDYGALPDQIILYQRAIERFSADTGQPLPRVIRDTILHEVGHFFGLTEEELARMGLE